MEDSLAKRLDGYKLTTAEILYHLPDHPSVLQTFLWQDLDIVPKFPILTRFLDYWSGNLDGKLHSVRVAVRGVIAPTELKVYGAELRMH
ncbi:MAG: Usg family protein [Alphaproteobacteria bacterium]|jgi:uncharacterized protein Usg